MNIFKRLGIAFLFMVFSTIGVVNSSYGAMLLFKGEGFFLLNMVLDVSNGVINTTGTGQPYLNNVSFLKLNLYPTLEDKEYKSTFKIKINPYATGNDYLIADGFNFIYDTDKANVTIFVNRYGFRFNDPMFSGFENYGWEYSKYSYDKPVYFAYNNTIHTPAFYDGNTDDRFMRLGYGLTGLYLSGKGDLGYEVAAYLNKWQTSSHIQGNVNYNLGMLKLGVLAKVDNHPNNDIAKGSAHNATNFQSALSQKYNTAFVVYSLGLFGNVDLSIMNLFFEGVYRSGKGLPGNALSTAKTGLIDIYAGIGTGMFEGNEVELSAFYRMDTITNSTRMNIDLKAYSALEFGDMQLFQLAWIDFLFANQTGTAISGNSINLSLRFIMFDTFGIRLAGSYENYAVSSNVSSDLSVKAAFDFYIDEMLTVYAGVTAYGLLATTTGNPIYSGGFYFLPVVGLISSPFESLRLSLTFGYDVESFRYDFDGANHENMVTKKLQSQVIDSVNQTFAVDWLTYVANPSIAFTASIVF